MLKRASYRTAVGLAWLLGARTLVAQSLPGAASPTRSASDPAAEAVAPVLEEHADPIYPAAALRERIGGTVGLGTVVYAVSIGPLLQLLLPAFTIREPVLA